MRHSILHVVLLFLCSISLIAQTVRIETRRGNKSYDRGSYQSARAAYLSAIARDTTYLPARLGLGDALYQSGDTVAAVQVWQRVASDRAADPHLQALAWHNLGNRCMDTQQYDKAIEAYKEALRRNPTDDETRYNLALAIKLNKRPPQQGGGGGGGRSPQPNQPQTPPDNQPPRQPQGQEPTLDKSQADHILDALRQEEQHTRQRINQQNSQQNQPNKKNW